MTRLVNQAKMYLAASPRIAKILVTGLVIAKSSVAAAGTGASLFIRK